MDFFFILLYPYSFGGDVVYFFFPLGVYEKTLSYLLMEKIQQQKHASQNM